MADATNITGGNHVSNGQRTNDNYEEVLNNDNHPLSLSSTVWLEKPVI